MSLFEKIGLFLVRLLCVWLVLLALRTVFDLLAAGFVSHGTRDAIMPFAIRIVVLLVGAVILNALAPAIARYLGKDLRD